MPWNASPVGPNPVAWSFQSPCWDGTTLEPWVTSQSITRVQKYLLGLLASPVKGLSVSYHHNNAVKQLTPQLETFLCLAYACLQVWLEILMGSDLFPFFSIFNLNHQLKHMLLMVTGSWNQVHRKQVHTLLATAACLRKEALNHIKYVPIPLPKTSHMANLTVNGTEKYTLIQGKRPMSE